MNRLMGKRPNPDSVSPSTGVMETVVKVEVKKMCTVATSANNLKWQRLEYNEEALELIMITNLLLIRFLSKGYPSYYSSGKYQQKVWF